MHEEQITQVAKVLEEWNPLGDAANTVDELGGGQIRRLAPIENGSGDV